MSAFAPRIAGGMAKTTLKNIIITTATEGVDRVDDSFYASTLHVQ